MAAPPEDPVPPKSDPGLFRDDVRGTESSGTGTGRSCGCGNGRECGGLSRRDFLIATGAGAAALWMGTSGLTEAAAEESMSSPAASHLIPSDKNLSKEWLRKLVEKGTPEVWDQASLQTIGMPVGGIGTGQLYLCGDGTLGNWEIFNEFETYGSGDACYPRRLVKHPVDQGFAILLGDKKGASLRPLRKDAFQAVSFRGEYPIGCVSYTDPQSPVRVEMEAFSPFIPLNAKDSGLPATVFLLTLENRGRNVVEASVVSWLENPVGRQAADLGRPGDRRTRYVQGKGDTRFLHQAAAELREPGATPVPIREPVVLADFEGTDFGKWVTTGKAFGLGPVEGSLDRQQNVTGFEGKRLANSFHNGDEPHGILQSPAFVISRQYINLLVGGGRKTDTVGVRLLVDGRPVRSVTGMDSEHLVWRTWYVGEFEGNEARLEAFDNASGPWGHVNLDAVELADTRREEDAAPERFDLLPDWGTMGVACADPCLPLEETILRLSSFPDFQDRAFARGEQTYSITEKRIGCLATRPVRLKPGEKRTVFFVLAWHFPNTVKPGADAGHDYAARFGDADAVLDYLLAHRERLVADTRTWRDTYYDSTLPVWLLDRLHLTACCLATGTTQWWKNGRFWAWEGVACCEGTCTHVYNYAQSLARLFPELERNVREQQDFGAGFDSETGLVGFRGNRKYASDGQCGTILKVWREHQMSADDAFLRRTWPSVKKALGFLLQQDKNGDGLIENAQHNTYDIEFHGANTFVGSLYLGALRAGEEMAREMGEGQFADFLRTVFDKGTQLSVERLWNGEYFIQEVDLTEFPRYQYAQGCLSDQMFGQSWAHQVGLGYLYPQDKVKSALQSVWKYNWAPDVGPYQARYGPERRYADPGEAGLLLCTWPTGPRVARGVMYKNEVWTGIEYQVASHMIREGLVQEGLAICRAIHERYAPLKRNPYNEVECGDFYARAMASWGVLLALAGFAYHGPKGRMAFAPRLHPEQFRVAFTAAAGWGTYEQCIERTRFRAVLSMRWGELRLRRLSVEMPKGSHAERLGAWCNTRSLEMKTLFEGNHLTFEFREEVTLGKGDRLEVVVGVSPASS